MDRRILLASYVVSWILCVIGVFSWSHVKNLKKRIVSIFPLVPSVVAISMIYVFYICHGETVAQFVAGSESGRKIWSLWFNLWPFLLFSSLGSVLFSLIASIVVGIKKEKRKWLPITLVSLALSLFAFFVVAYFFPDA